MFQLLTDARLTNLKVYICFYGVVVARQTVNLFAQVRILVEAPRKSKCSSWKKDVRLPDLKGKSVGKLKDCFSCQASDIARQVLFLALLWGTGLLGVVISLAPRKSEGFDSPVLHHKEARLRSLKTLAAKRSQISLWETWDLEVNKYFFKDAYSKHQIIKSINFGN